MSAYLPLLVILISVGLVFVHGGLLVFWRSDRKSSSYYMTRSFGVTVTFLNVVAFAVALAVSCVLTDGLRQTCLSFMLITDYNFRPVNCQMGFDSLDLNYNMRGTLYLIGFGILGAWLSVIFTLISVVMYTIRAGCCRCTLHWGGNWSTSSVWRTGIIPNLIQTRIRFLAVPLNNYQNIQWNIIFSNLDQSCSPCLKADVERT